MVSQKNGTRIKGAFDRALLQPRLGREIVTDAGGTAQSRSAVHDSGRYSSPSIRACAAALAGEDHSDLTILDPPRGCPSAGAALLQEAGVIDLVS